MNGLNRLREGRHVVSGVFIFLLLGIFAVFSTVMVLFSAQFYRATVDQTTRHNEERVLYHYVVNAVRGNDAGGSVAVREEAGLPVLSLGWEADGDRYETRIYCHDGALRELFTDAADPFDPEDGEVICPAEGFIPVMEDGLLTLTLTDGRGETRTIHMALRCGEAGT